MKITKQKSFARAVAYFIQRWILYRSYLLATIPSLGLVFKVKTQDVVGRHIYKYHAHEPEMSAWIVDNVEFEAKDLFLDIGANIGWYSLLLSKLAKPSSSIYAFEPDPLNNELLRHNVSANAASSIQVVEAAVTESSGHAKLYRYNSNNLGRHSMLEDSKQKHIEVKTVGLDEFIGEQGLAGHAIKLLKIDVEGYEYNALKSGREVLSRCKTVLCEYSPGTMREHGIEPQGLLDLFTQAGLKPNLLAGHELEPVSIATLLSFEAGTDIIWVRD